MPTIFIKDDLRASVEAASGGKQTVLYTASGQPCIMNVIPKFMLQDIDPSLGTGVHPAFIVNGVEKSEIFIGTYQGIVKNDELLSLPGVDPTVGLSFDAFLQCSANNGPGWHMMTHAEWAAVALWCRKNGFLPRGNSSYGKSSDSPWETGRRVDGKAPGDPAGTPRTLTGSGPASWRHDNTHSGIADLNGNVWEWVAGIRLKDGEIQLLANNDAADTTKDQSENSPLWKAILASDGTLVAPGTSGTLKYDANGPVTGNGTQSIILSDGVANPTNPNGADYYILSNFENLGVKAGLSVPSIAKTLCLYPLSGGGFGGDTWYLRNHGERMIMAGGYYDRMASSGIYARRLMDTRSGRGYAGTRVAFVL